MLTQKLEKILVALKDATSIKVISQFLKGRGLKSSAGSWEKLLDDRLRPAIAQGAITDSQLVSLLTTVEEHGRQHVFLYNAREPARIWPNDDTLNKWLRDSGKIGVLTNPVYLESPASLTLCRVERGKLRGVETLKLTFATTREEKRKQDEKFNREKTSLLVTYALEKVRHVNVIRLHRTGLLELRIGSSSHTSGKLSAEAIAEQFAFVQKLLPLSSFTEVNLAPAKQFIWKNRAKLRESNELKQIGVKSIDDFGSTLAAASAKPNVDLSENGRAEQAIEQFEGTCEESNVCFQKDSSFQNYTLERPIHVRVSGRDNEFVLGARCVEEEYEYVLGKLREYLRG